MNHPASDAWNNLDRETQRAEISACSERFLAYLEWLADSSGPYDLPGYHDELIAAVRRERADNARLRALVKAAEWKGDASKVYLSCPWCGVANTGHGGHPDCPAFTPDGKVK